MKKYRKKPVVIEAMQLTKANVVEAAIWCGGVHTSITLGPGRRKVRVNIRTLEGTMAADEGDWIIRGVEGEFYPCKPDIFAKTYEEAE